MLFKGNSSTLQSLIDKLPLNQRDTPKIETEILWASKDSPRSSFHTPNCITMETKSKFAHSVGSAKNSLYACHLCKKVFPRHSYLKKHEQTHADHMPFRCNFCQRLFKHKRSRDRHVKLHTGDKKYKCNHCEAAFSRSDHLKIHMKTHDNQKPFQCTICNRGYNTAAALTSHMQNHKRLNKNVTDQMPPGPTFKCLQCNKLFFKPKDLQNHMKTHESKNSAPGNKVQSNTIYSRVICLTCTYCTRSDFLSTEALQTHVQSLHKSDDRSDLQCELFSETASHLENFPISPLPSTSPFNTISLPSSYYCEHCVTYFSSQEVLLKHVSTMHRRKFGNDIGSSEDAEDRPLSLHCVHCAVRFHSPSSLIEHNLFFHGYSTQLFGLTPSEQMRPFDLSTTHKVMPITRSVLNGSEIPLLPKNGSYIPQDGCIIPLICNYVQCSAAFNDFKSFHAHVRSHIEKKFKWLEGMNPTELKKPTELLCPLCHQTFLSSKEISQHLLAHFLLCGTTYNCERCHKAFKKTEDLQKHLMNIHSRHLYTCSICNEVFDSKMTIQVHFASRHNNEAKVYRCSGCPSSHNAFYSKIEFAAHVNAMHITNSVALAITPSTHVSCECLVYSDKVPEK